MIGLVLVVVIVAIIFVGYTGLLSSSRLQGTASTTAAAEALTLPAIEAAKEVVTQVEERGSILVDGAVVAAEEKRQSALRAALAPLYPITIGTTKVEASVADDPDERVRGLSDTLGLPDRVVKLFVFETPGPQGIWMKDMRYPIDIIWLDATGMVVHVKENVLPESYPKESFASPVAALYVIEAEAGFVVRNSVTVGTTADLRVALASQ